MLPRWSRALLPLALASPSLAKAPLSEIEDVTPSCWCLPRGTELPPLVPPRWAALVVGGFLSEYFPAAVRYLGTIQESLTGETVPFAVSTVSSTAPLAGKASQHLRRELRALHKRTGRPVVFVAHSLGGLRALQAILDATPEERKMIGGLLALQSPFQGAVLARGFRDHWIASRMIWLVLREHFPILTDMAPRQRTRYYRAHGKALQQHAERWPLIAATSSIPLYYKAPKSVLGRAYNWVVSHADPIAWVTGQPLTHDWLVQRRYQVLPVKGSKVVRLPAADHFRTTSILGTWGRKHPWQTIYRRLTRVMAGMVSPD